MRKFLTLGIMLASIGAFANGSTPNSGNKDEYCEVILADGTKIMCWECNCADLVRAALNPGGSDTYQPPRIEKPSMEGGISGL